MLDRPSRAELIRAISNYLGERMTAFAFDERIGEIAAESGDQTVFSGILSRRPGLNDAVLAGVNAAVEAMGRALARDLAPVRVNTLSPEMTRDTGAYLSMPEEAREGMYSSIASRLPVQRVGSGEDIAEATLMLMTNGYHRNHSGC